MHFQVAPGQGKLVWASLGKIFDVAVDIRKGSQTFGRWVSCTLSASAFNQLIVPKGQGHNMWTGFFQCAELVAFVKANAQ